MKAEYKREDLALALQKVMGAIDTQSTRPILTNVLVEAQDGQTRFCGTNDQMRVTVRVPGKVARKGDMAVPAKILSELVGRISDKDATVGFEMDAEKGRVKVTVTGAQKFSGNLPVLPKDDFPKAPEIKGEVKLALPAGDLLRMLKLTVFAAASDDSRMFLTGVLFDLDGGFLNLVSTDSHRLAFVRAQAQTPKTRKEYLVPVRAANEMIRCLTDDATEVTLACSDNRVSLTTPTVTLQTQLIAEKFPNYRQVIPKEFQGEFLADPVKFAEAVRLVSVFTEDKNRRILLKLISGQIQLTASGADRGSGDVTLPVEYKGGEIEMAFNADYCLDALKHVESPKLRVRFISPKNPCVFESPGNENHIQVIMPMRL